MGHKATTSSTTYGQIDGERGAGGKLRKPPPRKSQATPYDRPASNQQGRGWWFSKLVDPAYRLVASGATKILPAFLSTAPSVAALPPSTENPDCEAKEEVEVPPSAESNKRYTSSVGASEFTKRSVAGEAAETGKLQDEINLIENDSPLSGIEQLIKGKTFTRDEINRLTEILSSRVSDASDVEVRKRNEIQTTAGGNLPNPLSKASDERNRKDLKKVAITSPVPVPQTVPDEIGASPIELARAYMGSRLSEYGPGPSGVSRKDETSQQLANEFAPNPFIPSSAPRSSICWPGAMAQEQHGYTTPNQTGRHGLHDFPRTPYSRSIYSKSRARTTQMQTDSKYVSSSPDRFKQSQTPNSGQVKYGNDMLDNSYGSVGPIRRMRLKYASEVKPRGSIFSKYSKDALSVVKPPSVTLDNQSDVEKSRHLVVTSTSKRQPGDLAGNKFGNSPFLNPSTDEAVKRILDQLDKPSKSTTDERMNEYKLAMAWRKSPTEASGAITKENMNFSLSEKLSSHKKPDVIDSKVISKGFIFGDHSKHQGNLQEGNAEVKETVDASSKAYNKDNGDSLMRSGVNAFSLNSTAQPKSFEEKAGQSIFGDSKFEPLKKPPLHSTGTRQTLPPISVGRHVPGRSMSSDNGTGFTFPVSTSSSTFSEPPTPSITPFTSGGVVSQQKDLATIPAYSFGSNKSTPRLVFSFPSTSGAPPHVDARDLKFSFGSDKQARLSFGSVGKDAICY